MRDSMLYRPGIKLPVPFIRIVRRNPQTKAFKRRYTTPSKDTKSPNPSNASQSPSKPTLESAPFSISGPAWLWEPLSSIAYPLTLYSRMQARRPYIVQVVSSLVIYFLGDISSQVIELRTTALQRVESDTQVPSSFVEEYDTARAMRSLVTGGIMSIPSYHWFLFLGRHFNVAGSHILSLVYKIVVNQVIFAPFFNTYFFGMHSVLASFTKNPSLAQLPLSRRLRDAGERVAETLPTSWWNSCHFWPIVNAFSFTFVASQLRSVFAACAGVGWQTYLGLLNQKAAEKERRRALKAVGG